MAGDWIKLRKELLTSPKVVRISSALKADRLRVVGGLVSVWSLFDSHSADGMLEGYTAEALDDVIHWPGFAMAMVAVQWLDVNDGFITIPRFDEHMSKAAKRRADDTERKRTKRGQMSAPQADEMRTREEKRRSLPNGKEVATSGSRLPSDWQCPDDWMQETARLRPEWTEAQRRFVADSFRDHWIAKPGKDGRKADWKATWCNWCRNQKPFANGPPPASGKQAHRNQFFGSIYGRTDTENAIDGTAERVMD